MKRRQYAVILTIILIISIAFSLGILIKDRDHACHEEHCIVCRRIDRAEKILSLIGTKTWTFHFRKTLALWVSLFILPVLIRCPKTSLIEEKVRLNI